MTKITASEARRVNGGTRLICDYCGYTIKTPWIFSACLMANKMNYHTFTKHGKLTGYTVK